MKPVDSIPPVKPIAVQDVNGYGRVLEYIRRLTESIYRPVQSTLPHIPERCLYCGTPIVQPAMGVQYYCSDYCRTHGYLEGLRPKIGHQAEKLCKGCGSVFYACMLVGDFCSISCYTRHSVKRKAQKAAYHVANREYDNARSRAYYAKNSERICNLKRRQRELKYTKEGVHHG